MFENGSYLRRRKRFKLPRKGQAEIKDITAMAMADLQHYEASQRKAMLQEQAKLRSLTAIQTNSSPVFNNLNNLTNLTNLTNLSNLNNANENDLLKLTASTKNLSSANSNCASPMSIMSHHSMSQSNLTTNNLLPNSSMNSSITQAAAAAAAIACADSLRNYNGAFNMANVLNGHRLFNQQHQNNHLTTKDDSKLIKNENTSTLSHLGNLEGLFNKVGNKSSFSIDHLLNSNKDTKQEIKKSISPNLNNNNNSNANNSKSNYQEQLMAAARQQLAAMTALGFANLNDKTSTMSSDQSSAAQLNEFYNQFLSANSYAMNAAAAALTNFNSALNSNALRQLNQNQNNNDHNQISNSFTQNFHQQAANLLSTAGSANLTPPPNSNSPLNEDEKVCVDEQIDEEKEQIDDNDDDESAMIHSPSFSINSARSGRSSTVNIEEDCD